MHEGQSLSTPLRAILVISINPIWAGSFYYMAYQVLMQLFAANIVDPARWQIPHLSPDPSLLSSFKK